MTATDRDNNKQKTFIVACQRLKFDIYYIILGQFDRGGPILPSQHEG